MNNPIFAKLRRLEIFCFALSLSIAYATVPMFSASYKCIPLGEFMAVFAMSFYCPLTATYIFAYCYGLKMFGVNTVSNSTQMIETKPLRYFADQSFVRNSVSEQVLSVSSKLSISTTNRCRPQPAFFSFFHFRPKKSIHWRSSTELTGICQ